jgi:hypothetical protein
MAGNGAVESQDKSVWTARPWTRLDYNEGGITKEMMQEITDGDLCG